MESNWEGEIKGNWNLELSKSELQFWEQWFMTKGLDWPEDYWFRRTLNTDLQDWIGPHLPKEAIKILDVGSGPLTVLGKYWNGQPLNITCCDALAQFYLDLMVRYKIDYPIKPLACDMESLSEYFRLNSFNFVHAQNCVDHSYDPLMAINEMLLVCEPGGKVFLRHEQNEAEREHYNGLHQWNFTIDDAGEFVIGSKFGTQRVYPLLRDIWGEQISMETWIEGEYILTVIEKGY